MIKSKEYLHIHNFFLIYTRHCLPTSLYLGTLVHPMSIEYNQKLIIRLLNTNVTLYKSNIPMARIEGINPKLGKLDLEMLNNIEHPLGAQALKATVHNVPLNITGHLCKTNDNQYYISKFTADISTRRTVPRIKPIQTFHVFFGNHQKGKIVDISTEGVCFETNNKNLEIGSELPLTINIGQEQFTLRGLVKRFTCPTVPSVTQQSRVGVQFLSTPDKPRLTNALLSAAFPELIPRVNVGDQTLELIKLSGYLDLRSNTDIDVSAWKNFPCLRYIIRQGVFEQK